MAKVKITADSTCDLSPELLQKYDVAICPLYIVKDGQSLRDGVDIQPQDIYDYVEQTGNVTKTAALPAADYVDFFRPFVEDGYEVVHINISSGFSSCHQNACLAAEELGNVYPVDSLNLSTGSGLSVIEAAVLAKEGKSGAEIRDYLNREVIPKVEASFVIDTLKYLHKGGRCSSVAALGANLLKLKPCIEVADGKMHVGKKYRGPLVKCIEQYVTDRLKDRTDINRSRIFITHTDCPQEIVDAAYRKVKENGDFAEILETTAGCTVSNHCGPGTLGVLFIRK